MAGVVLCCSWRIAGPARREEEVRDLSALIAPELPCYWSAGMPPVVIDRYLRIGPLSAYNSEVLVIDEHDGTQFDAPAHFVPRPGSKLPNAGEAGLITSDKVPIAQFVGEACVIDCSDLLDKAKNGLSPLITKDRVQAWEKKHRTLGAGDVVVFRSGFGDKYYKPFPEGRRYIAAPVAGEAPGWPDPDADCMDYPGAGRDERGHRQPEHGTAPERSGAGDARRRTAARHDLDGGRSACLNFPATGRVLLHDRATTRMAPAASGALSISGEPAAWLIEAARSRRVADLSVLLAETRRSGGRVRGSATTASRITPRPSAPSPRRTLHGPDAHARQPHRNAPCRRPTLPPKSFDKKSYLRRCKSGWRSSEGKYGPRGNSDVTTEKVSAVADVRLCGSSTSSTSSAPRTRRTGLLHPRSR
jgi:kynurenine formamidase